MTSSSSLLLPLLLLVLTAGAMDAGEKEHDVVLRVELQNAHPAVAQRSAAGPIQLRVRPPTSLSDLHNALRQRLLDVNSEHEAVYIEVELFDAKQQQFLRLDSIDQLPKRRARLNVIVRDAEGADQDNASKKAPLLALPSKMFDINVNKGRFSIQGVTLTVDEVGNAGKGTGLTTWDGSVVLAKYLEHARMNDVRGKRIVELGAGTGLVGISAALMGARETVLTDLEYTMANLEHNVAVTMAKASSIHGASITTKVLDWFAPPLDTGDLDMILASDVVWVEELIAPLVQTMATFVRQSRTPVTVLMSYQRRSVRSDEILFQELERHRFQKLKVPASELHPQFRSDRIDVWEITVAKEGERRADREGVSYANNTDQEE